MNSIRSVVVIAVTAASLGCSSVQGDNPGPLGTSGETRYVMLNNLAEALASTGKAVRLNFHGSCYADGEGILLPKIAMHSPVKGVKTIDAVRQIFSGNPDIEVSEDSSGLLWISIGHVSTELLSIKVRSLALDERAQYNPNGPGGAIDAIEHSAEVKAAMTKFKLDKVPSPMDVFMQPAKQTLPHLPNSLSDLTVEQLLDSVARTFHGIVVYGECKEPNGDGFIDIGFSGVPDGQN